MRIIYIINDDLEKGTYLGVKKKIEAQIRAFIHNNCEIMLYNFNTKKENLFVKVLKNISLLRTSATTFKYTDNLNNANIYYIRYKLSDFYFIKFLKKIKDNNPNSKIVIEIPTFPYEGEMKGFKRKLNLYKDRYYSRYLSKYVDKIVTFSNDEYIFNIPTIKIMNGIDSITISSNTNSFEKKLVVTCVANISFWHGYDRFIKGLYEYNNNNNNIIRVQFNIVGEGDEVKYLKSLVNNLNLSDSVIFHGPLYGVELDKILEETNIGIDHLGLHRKGLYELSSLKSKEYCARGIPFILSHEDSFFSDKKYIKKVESNDSNIDVNEIIYFAKQVCNQDISEQMILDAKEFTWEKIMKNVLVNI